MAKKVKEATPIKDKKIGLILAIFLSFWTWLYTYKADAWKFWVGLCASILLWWTLIVPAGIWLWAVIDSAMWVDKK